MGPSISEATGAGVGVFLKKVLGSGRVGSGYERTAEDALRFVFETPGVTSGLIGTLKTEHLRQNTAHAAAALRSADDSAGETR